MPLHTVARRFAAASQELSLHGKLHARTLRIAARVVSVLLQSQVALETADLSANSLDGSSYALVHPQARRQKL